MLCGVITLILLLSQTVKRVAEPPTTSFGKNKVLTDSSPVAVVSNYPTDKAINYQSDECLHSSTFQQNDLFAVHFRLIAC